MRKNLLVMIISLAALSVYGKGTSEPFHETVDFVDMNRFSGDWYVIALIPTSLEKNAEDGIENYSINENNEITVKYTYKKGKPELKDKTMYQKGWIYNNETNADWRVQPLWPLKLPYYILELNEYYTYTVIGTNNYKYLWIMSRTPKIDEIILQSIIKRMVLRGFDRDKIIMMPQSGAMND